MEPVKCPDCQRELEPGCVVYVADVILLRGKVWCVDCSDPYRGFGFFDMIGLDILDTGFGVL